MVEIRYGEKTAVGSRPSYGGEPVEKGWGMFGKRIECANGNLGCANSRRFVVFWRDRIKKYRGMARHAWRLVERKIGRARFDASDRVMRDRQGVLHTLLRDRLRSGSSAGVHRYVFTALAAPLAAIGPLDVFVI